MENYQTGDFTPFGNTGDGAAGFNMVANGQDNFSADASQFFDDQGNYRLDEFESLGGLHYMNYLHSHDDML